MSRRFTLRFTLAGRSAVQAAVALEAGVDDLASEIMDTPGAAPSCALRILFELDVRDPAAECPRIERETRSVWGEDVGLRQTLSADWRDGQPAVWRDAVEVSFNRRINEEQMGDLPDLIAHMIATLERLEALGSGS